MTDSDSLTDLVARLNLIEISCAFIYFCLVERTSNCVERIPVLSSVPLFLFILTSILSLLFFMTGWFAFQMFIKTTLVHGLGMDRRNVTAFAQPLCALFISIWNLDMVVEDFWIHSRKRPGSFCQTVWNLYLFVWCGPFAILSGLFFLMRKLAYTVTMFTLRTIYMLIRLMLFPFLGSLRIVFMVLIVIIVRWQAPALLDKLMPTLPTLNNVTNFASMIMELL